MERSQKDDSSIDAELHTALRYRLRIILFAVVCVVIAYAWGALGVEDRVVLGVNPAVHILVRPSAGADQIVLAVDYA